MPNLAYKKCTNGLKNKHVKGVINAFCGVEVKNGNFKVMVNELS